MANYISKTFKAEQHKMLGDFHTHTVYSLHGMSSPSEVVQAAINAGLRYVAITDHFYPLTHDGKTTPSTINQLWYLNQLDRFACYKRYFRNDQAPIFTSTVRLTDERANIPFHVIPGYEISVLPYNCNDGLVRATDELANHTDLIKILAFHSWYTDYRECSIDDALSWVSNQMDGKEYTFFAHPEREIPKFIDVTLDKLIRFYLDLFDLLKAHNMPVELNESTLRYDTHKYDLLKWIDIAKKKNMMIVMNSDAHCAWDVGELNHARILLEQVDYPTDLIINIDNEKIKQYILK